MAIVRTALVFLMLLFMAESAKILVLTAPIYSHCLEVSAVGGELATKGHEVKIFLGSNFEHNNCFKKFSDGKNDIRPIFYQSPPGLPPLAKVQLDPFQDKQNADFNFVSKVFELISLNCKHLLYDKAAVLELKKEQFDLAIVDGLFLNYCIYAIPYTLNIAFVSLSTALDDFIVGRPTLASIVPSPSSEHTDKMSFWQRLNNGVSYIMLHLITRFAMPTDQISEYIPGVTAQSMFNIISKSELFIYNQDTVLGYPAPVMPNQILAGGIATQPSKPLQGEFKQIYSQSTSDIVLVTFGSGVGLLPNQVEKNLVGALKRLKATVLWKYLKVGKDENVMRVSWLPQNDLLGNTKTKLFISHCGNNGVYEALYHGVPLLCTPFVGDQFYNAMRVQHWKAGRKINVMTSTEEELFEAVSDTLNNPVYRDNMKKASAIFNSQPFTPRQRAAFWIAHVLKFGGDHLRSRGTDMCVINFLGYDLLLFVVVVGLVILLVFCKGVIFCYRRCCKGRDQKVKKS